MNTAPDLILDNLSCPIPETVIDVMLDRTQYRSKPARGDPAWARINHAVAHNRESIGLPELAHLLTQGCSFTPGVFRDGKRSNDTWVQQQAFGLDFDHDYRIEDFLAACDEWSVYPAFTYPTFNHTEQEHRFRAVFINDGVVTDKRLRTLVQGLLMLMFTKTSFGNDVASDTQCKDAARLFCGTNKPLIQHSFDSRINAIDLLDKYLKAKKTSDPFHYADWEKKIAADFGIDHRNRRLGVNCLEYRTPHSVSKTGENTVGVLLYNTHTSISPTTSIISLIPHNDMIFSIQWSSDPLSSKSLTKRISNQFQTPNGVRASEYGASKKPARRLTEKDKEVLLAQCRLIREFMSGEVHVGHHGRRILITNLRHAEGGIAWFEQGLSARNDYSSDSLIEDAARYQMKPEGCINCPHANGCDHKTNLLQQLPVRRRECRQIKPTPAREPVERTRERLREAIRHCMDSREHKLYVIKCDTGVGKTEELLNQDLGGVCVAFDTHRLKNEAYQRLRQKGRDAYLWPEPPPLPEELADRVQRCHAIGAGGTAEVYRLALETPAVYMDHEWDAAIQRHLQALAEVHIQSKVMATHEKAYQLQRNPCLHTFVFDEDFTKTLIRIDEVKIPDIETIRKMIGSSGDERYVPLDAHLKAVLRSPSRMTHKNTLENYPSALVQQLLLRTPKSFESPIEALFSCDAYRKDAADAESAERVFCITRQKLREDRKFVILSATADEQVYRMLFGDWLEFMDLSGTTLKGKLVCHTARSYSKQSIYSDPDAFAAKVQEDKTKYGFDGIITHKFCAQREKDGTFLKGSDGKVPVYGTFGGLQGLDSLGGTPVAVYGTPYPPEYVVKLWAAVLGLNMDEDGFDFAERAVEWNEFEIFVPTCSDDPDLQRLYLWLAHSEIVQAVGRARLVNNDCEVHVFAKLPVSGCVLAK